jgi:endonuclease YncB( thermonuclease family)
MRKIAILLIGMVSGMIINLAHSKAQESPEGRTELPDLEKADYTALARPDFARIEKVINANTIITQDGDIIRLVGLDIPHPPGEKGDIAHKAKAFLDQYISGKRVRLYAVKDKESGNTNRMGHELRHVELRERNIWIQGALLYRGLARVRTTPANPEMAGQMYALERRARKDNRGLWAKKRYHILEPDTAGKGIGAYQIVQGTVESTAMRGNRIYLNFGQNWRRDLTVSIPPGKRRAFRSSDIRPLKLGGEDIRARGWLESYNGPYMEIAHPARLEILDKQSKPEDKP